MHILVSETLLRREQQYMRSRYKPNDTHHSFLVLQE
jgi:hypothetical protein